MGLRPLSTLAFLAIALVAYRAGGWTVDSSPDTRDGAGLSEVVVRVEPGGLVHVAAAKAIELHAEGHESMLVAALVPVATAMPWEHWIPETGTGPRFADGWLRVRLALDATYGDLGRFLELAVGHPDLHLWKVALQIGPDPTPLHWLYEPRDVGANINQAAFVFRYTVERDEQGELRFGFARAPDHEPSEPYLPKPHTWIVSSGEPDDVRPRVIELAPGIAEQEGNRTRPEQMLEQLGMAELAAGDSVTGADLQRAIEELLPPEDYLLLGPLMSPNPWYLASDRARGLERPGHAFLLEGATLEAPDFLDRSTVPRGKDPRPRPECAHHIVEGDGLALAWRLYDHQPEILHGTTFEKLTVQLPFASYEPGTYDIERHDVVAVLTTGKAHDTRTATYGRATSGTVTLHPRGENAPALIDVDLELPLFRNSQREPEVRLFATERRTWSLVAHPHAVPTTWAWLGVHDEDPHVEVTPRPAR